MKNCILIPGNPAVANHYFNWIKEIKNRNSNINFKYATSYVLFSKKLNYVEYDQALREYYENLFLESCGDNKVTLIAHSVGSYFALRLLEKHPEKIEKIIIMFPYIGYSKSLLLKFTWIPYLIDRVFPLAELVSNIKNIFKKWDEEIQNISVTELTACLRFGVRQCVYFNKNKLDVKSIIAHKEKIYFLYTDNDKWCPEKTIEILRPISNSKKISIPHDFITNHDDREKMTDELILIL